METAKVRIETERGTAELEFKDLQEAMERMGAANLETLRRWVRSLEQKAEKAPPEVKAWAANERESTRIRSGPGPVASRQDRLPK